MRQLSGFSKHHREPDTCNNAARSFIRKIGTEEIKELADRLYRDIRELFKYKRRQFDYSCDSGTAHIKTPDFELNISINQDSSVPRIYQITTEITHLFNDQIADDHRFHTCFNHHCNRLLVQFPQAIDLEDKIDQIEEIESIADCLDYSPDCSHFELKLPSLDLRIHITESEMYFERLTLSNLAELLKQSRQAFDILTTAGINAKLSN